MIIPNEPLIGIQARIEELHSTITEKEEQIKARTRTLKDGLKEELSIENIVRQHPLQAAGLTFAVGFLITRKLTGQHSASNSLKYEALQAIPSTVVSTERKTALSAIGFEVLRSIKDIGVTYLQSYLEKKIRQ